MSSSSRRWTSIRLVASAWLMTALGCSVSPRPIESSKRVASLDVGCELPKLEVAGREGGRLCSADPSPLYVGSFTVCGIPPKK